MLTLGLMLAVLAATPEAVPSARLLTPAEVSALDRELRITDAQIREIKPAMPPGFVVGMALGLSFAVLLLPGLPLLIAGATMSGMLSAALIFIGGVLTTLGGVALVVGVMCAVLGSNAEEELAMERARKVNHRSELKRQLEPYEAPRVVPQKTPPAYVPGVQLDVPAPWLVQLVRF